MWIPMSMWFLLLFSHWVVSDSLWPYGPQHTRLPVLHHLPEFAQTHVHWVHDAIQPSHPLSPPSPLTSVFSSIRLFSSESALGIRWPKYWSFSISPSNKYSGMISFRIERFDLLSLQGILESLLQPHNSKVLVLWRSDFFMVQLLHWYITGKIIALTIQTFVSAI